MTDIIRHLSVKLFHAGNTETRPCWRWLPTGTSSSQVKDFELSTVLVRSFNTAAASFFAPPLQDSPRLPHFLHTSTPTRTPTPTVLPPSRQAVIPYTAPAPCSPTNPEDIHQVSTRGPQVDVDGLCLTNIRQILHHLSKVTRCPRDLMDGHLPILCQASKI